MADGQRAELLAPAIEEWLTADHEPACAQLDQACKDGIEVSVGTGMQNMKLQPEGVGSRLQLLRCGLSTRGIGWVDEHGNDGGSGDQLVQQLQPLRPWLHVQYSLDDAATT